MSYDVCLTLETGGEEQAMVTCSRNMTSNVAPVWREADADLAEMDGKKAGDFRAHPLATVRVSR